MVVLEIRRRRRHQVSMGVGSEGKGVRFPLTAQLWSVWHFFSFMIYSLGTEQDNNIIIPDITLSTFFLEMNTEHVTEANLFLKSNLFFITSEHDLMHLCHFNVTGQDQNPQADVHQHFKENTIKAHWVLALETGNG